LQLSQTNSISVLLELPSLLVGRRAGFAFVPRLVLDAESSRRSFGEALIVDRRSARLTLPIVTGLDSLEGPINVNELRIYLFEQR
jgi:hypothetical protein